MPKILHTARYTGTPWEILKKAVPADFTVETLEELNYDCLLRQAIDADYLLVSGRLPIDEGVLSVAKHLKMIQRTGVGTEMLDLETIKRHGIPVYVNKGVNARSVAEHTLTLILCCLKNIPQIDKNVKQGIWKKQQTGVTCHEIYGKTVGLVGMGAIGHQVATYLKVFGANVLYTDLFRQNDITEKNLALTCGKLINETALYDALFSGKLYAAALDVHYEEPIQKDSLLMSLENVILTPHIAGLSYEAFHAMMAGAIDNIISFENNDFEQIKSKKLL